MNQGGQELTPHAGLAKTEEAREVAMKQLSDMHQSIQDLERERDEIIDSIESQLTAVTLLHGIGDDGSEGGSEMSTADNSQSRGKRDTLDSIDSIDGKAPRTGGTSAPPPVSKSVFEAVGKSTQQFRRLSLKASTTNSVLSSMRQGAGGSTYSRDISDKMARIQAKVSHSSDDLVWCAIRLMKTSWTSLYKPSLHTSGLHGSWPS